MDKKIIFIKTSKGEDETKSKTNHLYGDLKRILGLIDNKSTVTELTKRAAPSLRDSFEDMLQKLVDEGFIQEQGKPSATLKMAVPKVTVPTSLGSDTAPGLDFTSGKRESVVPPVIKEQPSRNNPQEAANTARVAAEAALQRAEREAARIRIEIAAAQAKAKQEEEAKMRAEADVARLKAEQQNAHSQAELAAMQARVQQEEEAKMRAEAEVARLKAAQQNTHSDAELLAIQAQVKQEIEAKMRAEAEVARLKAEQQNTHSDEELLAIQAQVKQEADAKIRAEAEVVRLKEEQQHAQSQAELATQQAQKKLKAETQAKARAEAEAARLKARAEEEIHRLAEAQAKVWSDAEQRAKDQAAAHRDQGSAQQMTVPKLSPASAVQAVPRIVKTQRKPLPWGTISAVLLGLLVVGAALLPYVWPMQQYVTSIEQALSRQLKQPVHIDQLKIRLLPWPEMSLQNVYVGAGQELKAGNVVLKFGLVTLFSEVKTIKTIVIDNLALSAESFDRTLLWLQSAGGNIHFPVQHMLLQHAQISNSGLGLPLLNGVVDFEHGQILKASLNSEDGKLGVVLQPLQSRWQIMATIKENQLPLIPGMLFNELNLRGEVSPGTAYFNEIDGQLYDGQVVGSARLLWQNGWQIKGQVNIKNLELQKALPLYGIAGKLEGNANFATQGMKPTLLAKDIRIDGNLVVKQGMINKIDIVETARWVHQMSTAGSRTHFDELSTAFSSDAGGQHFRQIKISAGIMSARGSMDITPGKQISGQLSVDLEMRAAMGSVPLLLGGTLTNPVLKIQ
ncbi:MAG: hypothetical protein Q7S51_04755 [Gallionellaceae bacterium]|nr:hypothetical protein [Gallionellaceae bacterium]